VKNGEIVLNISMDATSSLKLGNELIEFKARFAGVARDIMVPVGRVIAIYARENGQGMAFPLEEAGSSEVQESPEEAASQPATEPESRPLQLARIESEPTGDEPEPPRPTGGGGRPALKRVK
jgi:stringent starvation protein B